MSVVGVLAMAYGGPDSPAAIPGYLADIRSGRPTPHRVLEEIRSHYERIGGSSPLLANSRRQVAALANRLGHGRYRCYLGMRHWSPWIEEVVGGMAEDGIEQAVAVILAPHANAWNNGRYKAKIDAGQEMYRSRIRFRMVESWHDAPGLVSALAQRVRESLGSWRDGAGASPHVVFCAHSLPVRVAGPGDPYQSQLLRTAQLVAQEADLPAARWSWSWISAGRSSEPWLGPSLLERLGEIATRGVRRVLCVPVGFVTDHVEVLYDIDVEARARAEELGMELARTRALDDDPLFIGALAEAVEAQAAALEGAG